jgi:hypothetical protein
MLLIVLRNPLAEPPASKCQLFGKVSDRLTLPGLTQQPSPGTCLDLLPNLWGLTNQCLRSTSSATQPDITKPLSASRPDPGNIRCGIKAGTP